MNAIVIKIKTLPLAPGEYYLNLFLKSLDEGINTEQLDVRSWTYGNGIKIRVKGMPTKAAVNLPWTKQLEVL
jgi:hypothetical protein